jgi:hypothetical protein
LIFQMRGQQIKFGRDWKNQGFYAAAVAAALIFLPDQNRVAVLCSEAHDVSWDAWFDLPHSLLLARSNRSEARLAR